LLRRALLEQPGDSKLRASLADLLYRTGRLKEALRLTGEMLRDDPDNPQALMVIGNVLFEKRKHAEALEYFRLALAIAPTDYLWARVARCHLKLKQPGPALEALREGETLAPNSLKLLRLRAEAARMNNDAAAEAAAFDRAASMVPAEPQAYFSALYPLLAELSPRRAALFGARLRRRSGQESNPHLLLFEAEALADSRDPDAARKHLTRLLRLEPDEPIRMAADEMLRRLDEDKPRRDPP